MRTLVKRIARKIPFMSQLAAACRWYRSTRELMWVPPGHCFSPIPSREDRDEFERHAGSALPRALPGIDLNETGQLALLDELAPYAAEQPFAVTKTAGLRYVAKNGSYPLGDAIILHAMLRRMRPRRIIEIGCGYSSAVILDTNEHYLNGEMDCTFIDPDQTRLERLLKAEDRKRAQIVARRLQEVNVDRFRRLESGDFLFVDSSHVAKLGSELNTIFFEILPSLAAGVHVHFHDIFYPFEYPPEWVREGRAWNEAYLLRAFLSCNHAFQISFFFTYLARLHAERFRRAMSSALEAGGVSLWLKKIRPPGEATVSAWSHVA